MRNPRSFEAPVHTLAAYLRNLSLAAACLGLGVLASACGTFILGNATPLRGQSAQAHKLDELRCKDEAALAWGQAGRQAGQVMLDLVWPLGQLPRYEWEKSVKREAWRECMEARGYSVELTASQVTPRAATKRGGSRPKSSNKPRHSAAEVKKAPRANTPENPSQGDYTGSIERLKTVVARVVLFQRKVSLGSFNIAAECGTASPAASFQAGANAEVVYCVTLVPDASSSGLPVTLNILLTRLRDGAKHWKQPVIGEVPAGPFFYLAGGAVSLSAATSEDKGDWRVSFWADNKLVASSEFKIE